MAAIIEVAINHPFSKFMCEQFIFSRREREWEAGTATGASASEI